MATAKGREANYIEGDKDMQLVLTAVGGPLGIGYGSTMPIHETSDNNKTTTIVQSVILHKFTTNQHQMSQHRV